jgi:hypothetical protein
VEFAERRGIGRADAPSAMQELAVGQFGENVVAVGIGAVAGLGNQRRGAHTVDQRGNLANPGWLDPQQHDGTASPDNFRMALHDALIKNFREVGCGHPALAESYDFAEDAKSARAHPIQRACVPLQTRRRPGWGAGGGGGSLGRQACIVEIFTPRVFGTTLTIIADLPDRLRS